ncbi:MAG: GTP 3',8-cyclase MoaA [Phycisphaeraceae bacterium]|nr:GTP 3',8-cyclase MoaA [Phycisphaeraceae bacterium]
MSLNTNIQLPVLGRLAHAGHDVSHEGPLLDPFERGVGYLRLSLTRACSMRCTYCRPTTYNNPRDEERLSTSEIEQIVRHLAEHHGLTKVRLTGGDPTSRPDLIKIIKHIALITGITDLAMTTNGLTLARMARRYHEAGLTRVNISLDTLDPNRFAALTGVDGLHRVMRGIESAIDAGLTPIKLNTVVVRGQNDQDLVDLVRFAARPGVEIRFIELMPMGPLADVWHERYLPAEQIKDRLREAMGFEAHYAQGHDAASRYRVKLHTGGHATVGFITPMSCNFCADCNRIRLAADGQIYPCLMDKPAGSLLPALRPGFDSSLVDALLRQALSHKQAEHPMFGQAIMTTIGG